MKFTHRRESLAELFLTIVVAVVPPSDPAYPQFQYVTPSFGPVSGYTNIAIAGSYLQMFGGIFAIHIGPTILTVTYEARSDLRFVLKIKWKIEHIRLLGNRNYQ